MTNEDKRARQAKQYNDYDWDSIAISYDLLNKLYVDELMKYLRYHDLSTIGNKKDKVMRIMAHYQEINNIEPSTDEQTENNETAYNVNDSEDEIDDDSDTDDEVLTLVESNSECSDSYEVDVTVSGVSTRSGRLSRPSSRFLSSDWLA